MRLVALAVPLVLVPLFFVLAPWRIEPWFVSRWALFAGERWDLLSVGERGAGELALLLAAGAGAALFLRDALPPLADLARRDGKAEVGPWGPIPARLERALQRQAAAHGIPPPAVRLVRSLWPVMLCAGGRDPEIVLSAATLRVLDDEELEAALGHELVHVRYRDPAWGYALIAVRAAGLFNPALQWTARTAVDEIERRADQQLVARGGSASALASALDKLSEARRPSAPAKLVVKAGWQAHAVGIQRRKARLAASPGPARPAQGWFHVALTAGGLAVLLFFVV
jgi:Zn-dependent protease with chaperone function